MNLQFPPLEAPYGAALENCVTWALERYEVVAIIASGTIIRGAPDRRSDLDIHVLHAQPFRERVQAIHAGVPCEIFVNPPSRIPGYFVQEAQSRRPMTAHMFATGVIVFDTDQLAQNLVVEAKATLQNPPSVPAGPGPGAYGAATMFEDVVDLAERDRVAAELLLGRAIQDLIHVRLAAAPGWLPRPKEELAKLRDIDPTAARLAVTASSATSLDEKLEAGRQLCQHVTGHEGFFEWVSEREPL